MSIHQEPATPHSCAITRLISIYGVQMITIQYSIHVLVAWVRALISRARTPMGVARRRDASTSERAIVAGRVLRHGCRNSTITSNMSSNSTLSCGVICVLPSRRVELSRGVDDGYGTDDGHGVG